VEYLEEYFEEYLSASRSVKRRGVGYLDDFPASRSVTVKRRKRGRSERRRRVMVSPTSSIQREKCRK
jgi:hypothetical protein